MQRELIIVKEQSRTGVMFRVVTTCEFTNITKTDTKNMQNQKKILWITQGLVTAILGCCLCFQAGKVEFSKVEFSRFIHKKMCYQMWDRTHNTQLGRKWRDDWLSYCSIHADKLYSY